MTVKQLRDELIDMPDDYNVIVWMPGTYIALQGMFEKPNDERREVLIEGNITDH